MDELHQHVCTVCSYALLAKDPSCFLAVRQHYIQFLGFLKAVPADGSFAVTINKIAALIGHAY